MVGSRNRAELLYHRQIADAVEKEHRARCPCCGRMMTNRQVKSGKPLPADKRTVGHDQPVSRGGSRRRWVWVCHACNNEQGWLTFEAWARMLNHYGDPRAPRVAALAALIERLDHELHALPAASR